MACATAGPAHLDEKTGALMLKRLFQRPRTASTNEPLVDGAPPATPRGVRLYAVGDVHGRLDLLLAMEELIETDRREHGPRDDVLIVHLGDLVDRGFESRKVLDHLVATAELGPPKALILGNHDLWLREFVAAERVDPEQTGELDPLRRRRDAAQLRHQARPAPSRGRAVRDGAPGSYANGFPAEHAEFLDRLDLAFGLGDYFFCHAGIRPEVPLERQSEADLLWIREPFLSWEGSHGKIVVHGHTVEDAPVTRVNRIGIDTGACWTGRLTCLVLAGRERRFLQTGRQLAS